MHVLYSDLLLAVLYSALPILRALLQQADRGARDPQATAGQLRLSVLEHRPVWRHTPAACKWCLSIVQSHQVATRQMTKSSEVTNTTASSSLRFAVRSRYSVRALVPGSLSYHRMKDGVLLDSFLVFTPAFRCGKLREFCSGCSSSVLPSGLSKAMGVMSC